MWSSAAARFAPESFLKKTTARRRAAAPRKSAQIGIMGGTFDPVHFGHLRLAQEAAEILGLARVRWVPAGRPWHRGAPLAPAAHRLEMVRLAIQKNDLFELDDAEIRQTAPGYTVETLERLRSEFGPQRSLVLLLGTDAFRNLSSWERWRDLFPSRTSSSRSVPGIRSPRAECRPRSPRSGAGAPAPPMSCASGRVETSPPTAPRRSTSRRAPSAPTSPRRAARVTCCPRLSSITSRRTGCTPNRATPLDDRSSQAPEGRARGARGHQGARDRGLRRDPSHFDVRSRDHRERGLRAPAEGAGEPRPGKSESRGRPRLRRGGGGRRPLGAGPSGRHRPAHPAACGALPLQSRGAAGPAQTPKPARPPETAPRPPQLKLFLA